jgi:flagellar motor switch protein FliN/FliY
MADQEDQSRIETDVDAAMAEPAGDAANPEPIAPEDKVDQSTAGEPSQRDASPPVPKGQMPQSAEAQNSASETDSAGNLLQADMASALNESAEAAAAVETATEEARGSSGGKPMDEIAAEMTAAIEEDARAAQASQRRSTAPPFDLSEASALALDAFRDGPAEAGTIAQGIGLLSDVELQVKIELGRARRTVEEVLALGTGSVVELDRLAGDPVDILVNERLVARGEVLVLNDNLCIRVNEIVSRQAG